MASRNTKVKGVVRRQAIHIVFNSVYEYIVEKSATIMASSFATALLAVALLLTVSAQDYDFDTPHCVDDDYARLDTDGYGARIINGNNVQASSIVPMDDNVPIDNSSINALAGSHAAVG